jgi:hypothetical protein
MARKSGSSTANQIKKKQCSTCQNDKRINDFYMSYNPLHMDNRMPICKECIRNACFTEDGEFDIEKLYSILRQTDRPFLCNIWEKSINEVQKNTGVKYEDISYDAVLGKYFKNIALQQHRSKTWSDSIFDSKSSADSYVESSRRKSGIYNDKVFYLSQDDFKVTNEIIQLFGEGYTSKEYSIMNHYYETMLQDYPNITSSQKNLLIRYVRFAAKEELATSYGQTAEAEKWARLATDALKQLNAIDIQGNISSFSEFFRDFERTQDVTRILPQFKYRPNDSPDFIIWCYINYCRRLEGKPEVSYEDVYKFYDKKVEEYLKQYGDPYGIFAGDTTLENRDKINEFIDLPPDYEAEMEAEPE